MIGVMVRFTSGAMAPWLSIDNEGAVMTCGVRVAKAARPVGVTALAPFRRSNRGGSNAFLVLANDANRYWCKAKNNGQSEWIPVNEQIVGRLGRLVGISVCQPRLVLLPPDLAGWKFADDREIEPGWAHGSLAVSGGLETNALEFRTEDENARRHAGFFVLYDWLLGNDPQWLYEPTAQNAFMSHDHGYYISGSGNWDEQLLADHEGDDHGLGVDAAGISAPEVDRLANRLDEVTVQEIGRALDGLPEDWPVSDDQMTAVAHFAAARAPAVAARLRLTGGAT